MNNCKQIYFDCINYEIFGEQIHKTNLIKRFILKHITPNTSFVYYCRKMWYYHSLGGRFYKLKSKLLYLYIYRRYSCCVFEDAIVGKGLKVYHPLGIVIGHCIIGNNCTVLQNVTIGEKNIGENISGEHNWPKIGDNVTICAGACVLGNINVANDSVIAANSVVNKEISMSGVWGGVPVQLLKIRKK